MLANVQSLLPKIEEFHLLLSVKEPDVFCVTETWLNKTVLSSLIDTTGYSHCRNDRTSRRGGGTAIFVRDGIDYCHLQTVYDISLEMECSVIDVRTFRMFIMCVYIPPSLNAESLRNIERMLLRGIDWLLSWKPNYQIIITGDFNHFKVHDFCSALDLTDIVKYPTRSNSILDHILVSKGLSAFYLMDAVEYNAPIGSSDHRTLKANPLTHNQSVDSSSYHIVYDFRRSHLMKLLEKVAQIPWSNFIIKDDPVDRQYDVFYRMIMDVISESIPHKLVPLSPRDKEWITPITKLLIHERWVAYRKGDWTSFNHLKHKVKVEISKARGLWADRLKATPYGLWKLADSVNHGTCDDGFGRVIVERGGLCPVLQEIANLFSSMVTSDEPRSFPIIKDDDWSFTVNVEKVRHFLRNLKSSKSSGDEAFPTRLYKVLADSIALPVAVIFASSIQQRVFPNAWKNGVIVPLPKTNPTDLLKLRQVTLLSPLSKMMEKLVLHSVQPFFDRCYGLGQHGFRKCVSTTTALIDIMNSVMTYYDDNRISCIALISFDLSQAFDSVDHELLIRKLIECNFPTGFVMWLANYLSNRFSQVRLRSVKSRSFCVSRGVPQGSVLGPPLFCVYTSDFFPKFSTSKLVRYADDVYLIMPFLSSDANIINEAIDGELHHFEEWCNGKRLHLNRAKSKMIFHTRTRINFPLSTPIPMFESINILGVYFNKSFNWNTHIEKVCTKANQRFHFLRKLRPLVSSKELHLIYTASIRTILEYACPLFMGLNEKLSKRLQRIDRRAHRIICGDTSTCLCTKDSIKKRRLNISVKCFKKMERNANHLLHSLVPKIHRNSRKYDVQYCRTLKCQSSFIPAVTSLLNSLS